MDIVVADIPSKYAMLLSRSWGTKLQGSLQLDMSYATISIFSQPKKLYRDTLMKYVVSSKEKPQNFPIYLVHSDMDSFILYNVEIDPSTELEVLVVESKEITNDKSSVQIHEISENNETSNTQEKTEESKETNLPIKQILKTLDTNYEHEIL